MDPTLGTFPRTPPDSGMLEYSEHSDNAANLSYFKQLLKYGCSGQDYSIR